MKKMTTTKVINIFGGPGSGKSTKSAELFFNMKYNRYNVELVREYVKDWAWQNKKPCGYDFLYILGEQSHRESILYHIVEYIVTDSPIILGPFYEKQYTGNSIILPSALEFIKYSEANGVKYYNFFLERQIPFDERGRYETEDSAREIDVKLKTWLNNLNISYISVPYTGCAEYIMSKLQDYTAFAGSKLT